MKATYGGQPKYPVATIAPYGPDNKRATKLAVAVFKKPGHREPDALHCWCAQLGDARNDPQIGNEIADFLT